MPLKQHYTEAMPITFDLVSCTQLLERRAQTHSEAHSNAQPFWAKADVLVVMPSTEPALAKSALKLAASRAGSVAHEVLILGVMDDERMGLVALHNLIFKNTQSNWYAYLAQDAFAGRDWLALGLEQLRNKKAKLLGFNDGKWQGQIAAFGLAHRDWINSIYSGDFFYPGYRSHFADCELTLIAREQGVYAYEPNAVVVEVDADKDTKPVNADDRSMFKARCQNGFAGRVKRPELLQLIR
jgi:hypothetical protein